MSIHCYLLYRIYSLPILYIIPKILSWGSPSGKKICLLPKVLWHKGGSGTFLAAVLFLHHFQCWTSVKTSCLSVHHQSGQAPDSTLYHPVLRNSLMSKPVTYIVYEQLKLTPGWLPRSTCCELKIQNVWITVQFPPSRSNQPWGCS